MGGSPGPSLSRRLAQWAARLAYEDLPSDVQALARSVTLQALTSALLGADQPPARMALRLMEDEEPSAVPMGATALVHGRALSRGSAAFVNAEMVLCGAKWDTFRMLVHPGCAVIPAALAMAQSTGCSGREFLAGVAAGYEVMLRMASDFVPTVMARGFHAGPVFGIFGAAVAAGKIARLDADGLHAAIAQCVNLACGNLEGARSGGQALREGVAARNALLAVALARQGVRGGETALEGPAGFYHAYAGNHEGRLAYSFTGALRADLEAIARDLGHQWRMRETLLRIHSTPGYNVAHIEATAALCARDGIRAGEVDRVECLVNWLETQYPSPAFPSRRTDTAPGPERPHYYVAYAILRGGFPVTKNVQAGIGEPDPPGLQEMMARVRVIATQGQALLAPRITIHTRDGVAHTLQASGREFMMDFATLARRLMPVGPQVPIGAEGYGRLVQACRDLGQATDLSRLVALTLRAPA